MKLKVVVLCQNDVFVIPQIFFRTLLFILPKSIKSFKKIRMMLIKLAVPNNYELGSIQLNKKDDQTIK